MKGVQRIGRDSTQVLYKSSTITILNIQECPSSEKGDKKLINTWLAFMGKEVVTTIVLIAISIIIIIIVKIKLIIIMVIMIIIDHHHHYH